MVDWDVLGGPPRLSLISLPPMPQMAEGGFPMPSYVLSLYFLFCKIAGSPQFPNLADQQGVQKFGVNKNLPV
jgi:hypothetical protein